MNKLIFVVIALMIFCVSCSSSKVSDDYYNVSVEEMTTAIIKFRQSDDYFLFLNLVNREGRVVKIKEIEKKDNHLSRQDVKKIKYLLLRELRYRVATDEEPDYRSIFNSVKHRSSGYYGF